MLIGLTGGIGSGKSTVAAELRQRGYAVYDCDREAKRLMTEDGELVAAIKALLGEDVYEDGVYQTKKVAERVFGNPDLLQRLNALVHPAVKRDVEQWAAQKDVCFVESAILYQSGLDSICNKVVGVTAPKEVRIARTIARDNTTKELVCKRIEAQISDDLLRTYAHAIINNDGSESIEALVKKALKKLL